MVKHNVFLFHVDAGKVPQNFIHARGLTFVVKLYKVWVLVCAPHGPRYWVVPFGHEPYLFVHID